jgi:hypothetical protein
MNEAPKKLPELADIGKKTLHLNNFFEKLADKTV